jgi:hypothetical protein
MNTPEPLGETLHAGPGHPPRGRRRLAPYAIVLAVGVTLAAVEYVLDNRDPLVFAMPILGLTAVILLVMWLSGRGDRDEMEELAAETGLTYDGLAPLPAVTPILAGVTRPAHVLSGRLPDRGPRVRVAQVGRRLVAISPASVEELGSPAERLIEHHPDHPQAAVQDGLLVVALPREAGHAELLDLVEQLHARL